MNRRAKPKSRVGTRAGVQIRWARLFILIKAHTMNVCLFNCTIGKRSKLIFCAALFALTRRAENINGRCDRGGGGAVGCRSWGWSSVCGGAKPTWNSISLKQTNGRRQMQREEQQQQGATCNIFQFLLQWCQRRWSRRIAACILYGLKLQDSI